MRRRPGRPGPPGRLGLRPSARGPQAILLSLALIVVVDAAVIDHVRSQEIAEVVAASKGLGEVVPVRRASVRHAAPVAVQLPRLKISSKLVQLRKDPTGALQVPGDAKKAGWYVGSAHPGDAGPTVIAGHVDSFRGPGVFKALGSVRRGDVILVTRADKTVARFVVDKVETVSKKRFPTKAVYTGKAPGLRLITCGGSFSPRTKHYRDNVIVYASPQAVPKRAP